jgi:hypothetical protein
LVEQDLVKPIYAMDWQINGASLELGFIILVQ